MPPTPGAVTPAYDTKHETLLRVPIRLGGAREVTLELEQTDAYHGTTGTTLWLGGQASLPRLRLMIDCQLQQLGRKWTS